MLTTLDTNVWGYYNKLAAFTLNAKGVWDFCLGGLKKYFEPFCISLNIRIKRDHIIIVFNPVQ
ncbi:hypothetical protein VN0280_04490 [Helicobacter pylori]|nr:hypothetical protein VN0280_04490 [Helicobacter pylori]